MFGFSLRFNKFSSLEGQQEVNWETIYPVKQQEKGPFCLLKIACSSVYCFQTSVWSERLVAALSSRHVTDESCPNKTGLVEGCNSTFIINKVTFFHVIMWPSQFQLNRSSSTRPSDRLIDRGDAPPPCSRFYLVFVVWVCFINYSLKSLKSDHSGKTYSWNQIFTHTIQEGIKVRTNLFLFQGT